MARSCSFDRMTFRRSIRTRAAAAFHPLRHPFRFLPEAGTGRDASRAENPADHASLETTCSRPEAPDSPMPMRFRYRRHSSQPRKPSSFRVSLAASFPPIADHARGLEQVSDLAGVMSRSKSSPRVEIGRFPETPFKPQNHQKTQRFQNGAQGRNRTTDTAIFSRMLYQLSYLGIARPQPRPRWRRVLSPCPPGDQAGNSPR